MFTVCIQGYRVGAASTTSPIVVGIAPRDETSSRRAMMSTMRILHLLTGSPGRPPFSQDSPRFLLLFTCSLRRPTPIDPSPAPATQTARAHGLRPPCRPPQYLMSNCQRTFSRHVPQLLCFALVRRGLRTPPMARPQVSQASLAPTLHGTFPCWRYIDPGYYGHLVANRARSAASVVRFRRPAVGTVWLGRETGHNMFADDATAGLPSGSKARTFLIFDPHFPPPVL